MDLFRLMTIIFSQIIYKTMIQPKKLLILLTIISTLLPSTIGCDDSIERIDVGWKFKPTCRQIKNKYPELCSKKDVVKSNCPKSCGLCEYNKAVAECVDATGKFNVGNKGKTKRCKAAQNKPKRCSKRVFQLNCPQTCNLCTVDDDNSGGGDGEVTTNYECSGSAPDCCMGLTNTCNLRINELFFAAMHNANNDEDKWNSNHESSLELALEAGFRAFYLDVCLCQGQVVFCHGNCIWAGQQDPTEIFQNIVSFLNKNPSELVILNFEMSYGDPKPIQLWRVMRKVNGFKKKSYVHNGGNWPQVKNVLQAGKQIISLKHNGNTCHNTANTGCTRFIQEFFEYTVGTKYDFSNISEIQDIPNSCVGERGTQNRQDFYAINNFVTTTFPGPSEDDSIILNEDSFAKKRISDCEEYMNKNANFLAVDFWQRGDIPKIAKEINIERGGGTN